VLLLKSLFLRSLLELAIVYISNFPSGNLVDLICFLNCTSWQGLGSLVLRRLCPFFNILLIIHQKRKKTCYLYGTGGIDCNESVDDYTFVPLTKVSGGNDTPHNKKMYLSSI
jgi:hypothetical protein